MDVFYGLFIMCHENCQMKAFKCIFNDTVKL